MAIITCITENCGRSFLDTTGIRKLCHKCRKKARKEHRCDSCGVQGEPRTLADQSIITVCPCTCSRQLSDFYEAIRQQQES